LGELIDLAEAHNPETSLAWERARAQAAALGIARSELYPTLAAVALSQTASFDVLFGSSFFRQTVQTFSGDIRSQLHDLRFRGALRPNQPGESIGM
jgi:outer membrane protein